MSASIVIKWDRAPVRQSFGACNVVFDGVATVNGKSYRINGSANRACRKIEIALRYLTHAKRGGIVPASMLHDVRMAAMQSAAELLAPMRAEWLAPLRAELLALIRAETVSAPIRLRQLRGPDGQSVLVPAPVDPRARVAANIAALSAPVSVSEYRDGWPLEKVLKRFNTISEAESYIGTLPDCESGVYSINAPETMVNPPLPAVASVKER